MRTSQRSAGRAVPRRRRGFTLIELMVAVTGGLFVSIAVFMLAKQSTGLYQSEARISNATLGSVVGFERLRGDLERAGYLVTPNIIREPKLCGAPAAPWPAYLQRLQSVFIDQTGAAPARLATNGVDPDEIVMAGSYASVDQFPTFDVVDTGAQIEVTLQPNSPPMVRLGYDVAGAALVQTAILASVFGTGRILRFVDTAGGEQYGVITGIDTTDLNRPKITVTNTNPAILFRGTNQTLNCGIRGTGDRTLVNVVNLIRYSIQEIATGTTLFARYAPMLQQGPLSDARRTELIREELDATGTVIPGTEEVVTEFAVDLAFGVTVATVVAAAGGVQVTGLTSFLPGDETNIPQWAGSLVGGPMNLNVRGPQLIRGIRARLSVRSRQADRTAGVRTDGGAGPVAPGLYRFNAEPTGTDQNRFARVRTVQTEVALRSHRGTTWL